MTMPFEQTDIDLDPILRYLIPNENLPPSLYDIADQIGCLAAELLNTVPRNAERTTGFRKLLEAKDCFVRAALDNR